jgi:hypothetical protein
MKVQTKGSTQDKESALRQVRTDQRNWIEGKGGLSGRLERVDRYEVFNVREGGGAGSVITYGVRKTVQIRIQGSVYYL